MEDFIRNYNREHSDTTDGYTLLHYASEKNEFEIGKLLIQEFSFFTKGKKINAKDIIYQNAKL